MSDYLDSEFEDPEAGEMRVEAWIENARERMAASKLREAALLELLNRARLRIKADYNKNDYPADDNIVSRLLADIDEAEER